MRHLLLLMVVGALHGQEKPGAVEGTLVANGEPQAGIRVMVGRQESKTDAAGRYSFRDVPAGRHMVSVGEPFRSPVMRVARTVTVVAGQTARADFRVRPTASISGTVRDAFDEPAPGMEVVLLWQEYGAGGPRYFRRNVTATDDEGRYRIDYVQPEVPFLVLVFPIAYRSSPSQSDAPTDPRLRRPATVPTFFPTVSELAGAAQIVLRPGQTTPASHYSRRHETTRLLFDS